MCSFPVDRQLFNTSQDAAEPCTPLLYRSQYPQQQQQYYNPNQHSQPMIQTYQPFPQAQQPYQQQQYQPLPNGANSYQPMTSPTGQFYRPEPQSQNPGTQRSNPSSLNQNGSVQPAKSNQNGSSQTGVQRDDQPKDCTAPRVRGDFCSTAQQQQMFYYDSATKLCQPFMYNGCNGNGNRFETAAECKSLCIDSNAATQQHHDDSAALQQAMKAACGGEYAVDHLTPQQCGSNGQQCSTGYQCSSEFCCPTPDYLCNLRYDSGKFAVGGEKSDRYFYTSQYRTCMR
nr:Proteinase inhibitor I2 domain containing protein [Haemonchus contortus]